MKLTELLKQTQTDSYMDFEFLIDSDTIDQVEKFADENIPLFFGNIDDFKTLQKIKKLFMLNIFDSLELLDFENSPDKLNMIMDSNLNTISNLLTIKEFTLE
jgi:hypothetical protein